MPFLSFAERRAGRELGSATAVADSKQTLLCTYLSAAVLIGLLLNSLFGWWWADAIAGLVIAGFAVREGIEAWRGDACATSVGMLLEEEDTRRTTTTRPRRESLRTLVTWSAPISASCAGAQHSRWRWRSAPSR